MKRKFVTAWVLLWFCLYASYAQAVGVGIGRAHIVHIGPNYPNEVYFTVQTATGQPVCSNGQVIENRFIINLAAPGGKDAYGVLLAAELASKPVYVYGKGTCDLHPAYEDVGWVRFEEQPYF